MLRKTIDVIQTKIMEEKVTSQNPTEEDLTCPFHPGLKLWMTKIDFKVESIDSKLGKLLLWKISVVSYVAGASIVTVFALKFLRII
jgi:hypothetical protein